MTVTRFLRYFGADVYRNEAYPTDDKVVPWRLFLLLMQARRHVMAEERMQQAHATGVAIARAMNGDDAKVQAVIRREEREAYP